MMDKFLIIVSFLCLLSSCENRNDEILATIDKTGSVSFTVTDNEGNPVTGALISIYNNYSNNYYPDFELICNNYRADIVLSDSTDNNGKCDIENLLADFYCYVVSAKNEDGTMYSSNSFVVAAGERMKIDENPFRNVGYLEINVTDTNRIPIEGFNVGVFHVIDNDNSFYSDIENYDYVLSLCNNKGKTNVNGDVVFKLPMADQLSIIPMPYCIVFYLDSIKNTILLNNYICMDKMNFKFQDTLLQPFNYNSKIRKFVFMP